MAVVSTIDVPEEARGIGRPETRVSLLAVAATAVALAALWASSFELLHPGLPVPYRNQPALSPLYAFWQPLARPQSAAFIAAALALVLAAGRLCDPDRVARRAFGPALFACALILPATLFLVRSAPLALGSQFDVYANEEFLHDARRIGEVGPFLEHYVELMPQLSLHGRHFPPGHALLLYGVAALLGPGTLPAGIVILGCFASAVVLAWLALESITGARASRQGALLLLAAPSMLQFSCTSMDAVFLLLATLSWWLSLRAFGAAGSVARALAAGASLLLATCFSFSAVPLGLALFLHAIWAGRRTSRETARRLAAFAAAYAAAALILFAATGFSILACLSAARASADELMTRAAGADPGELWARFSLGNAVAFAIGSGLALATAVVARCRARPISDEAWTPAALLALVLLACGGMYHLETERIWLFAMPWLAAIAVSSGPFQRSSLRLLLVAGLLQALAMETLLFTLW